MNDQDFNCSITANVTAKEAVDAISRVSEWWAKNTEGNSQKLGDVFTVRFGDTFVTFEITAFTDTKIVWSVTDSYLPWQNDKPEWTDTRVVFDISVENNGTTIHFTHIGLLPEVECYDTCIKGWTEYITGSLPKLLAEGVGQPS